MALSILLVAPGPAALTLAHELQTHLDATSDVTGAVRTAVATLRREQFDLVVLEENLAESDTDSTRLLYSGAGATPVLEINFGLCGTDRIVRQVRSTLTRRAQDEAKARKAATALLHNQLNASVTGLLLESQLALRQAGPELLPSLQHLIELASGIRDQLRS